MLDHANGSGPATEEVPVAHVVGIMSRSVSAGGNVAMFLLEIAGIDGVVGKIAMTCDSGNLRALRSVVNEAMLDAERSTHAQGLTWLNYPREVEVACSDDLRNAFFLVINPRAEDEVVYAFPDRMGLGLSEGIRDNVLGRMTAAERAKTKSELLLPSTCRN